MSLTYNTSISPEEAKNILALINRANITGQEAITVAEIQKKLADLTIAKEGPNMVPGEIKMNPEDEGTTITA